MQVRLDTMQKIENTFRSFGYLPLSTPAIEKLEVLRKKGGDEIEGQIFQMDGGLGLRFDLTVPLARVVASNSFSLPFKRYCIAPVWRREEPQKGRFREFFQADIDIVGSTSPRCEAELLACAKYALFKLGFTAPKIMLNNRKVLNALAQKAGIPQEKQNSMFRALDKVGKQTFEKIKEEMVMKGISEKAASEIENFISFSGTNAKTISFVKKSLGELATEGANELEAVVNACKLYGFEPEISLSLVRGLDYYTGSVFEISASDEIGSVAGGGRYDNMIGTYGVSAPAVGISLGIERLIALLDEKKKSEGMRAAVAQLFIANVKPEFFEYAVEIAWALRQKGINCEIDLLERNLRKQFDYANASNVAYIAIVGEKEKAAKKLTLRDLKSGDEELCSIEEAIKKLSAKRSH